MTNPARRGLRKQRSKTAVPWLLWSTLLVLSCAPSSGKPPGGDPQSQPASEACSPTALSTGRLLLATTLERSKGKPKEETLSFETTGSPDLCVVIKTGLEDANGDRLKPAPASLSVILDSNVEIAGPSDFNAKPKTLWRSIDGSTVQDGQHVITAELRGKAGPNPGSAYIAVFAVSQAGVTSVNPVSKDRLEQPTKAITVVKDEAVVTAPDLDTDQLNQALAALPFEAIVIGRLEIAAIFQVLLPGADGGSSLRNRVAAINMVLPQGRAGLHYIGGFDTAMLPSAGQDRDYINPGSGALLSSAWHLDEINAEQAWDYSTGSPDTKVGAVDVGFNVSHADLRNNIESCFMAKSYQIGLDPTIQEPSSVFIHDCADNPVLWSTPTQWAACEDDSQSDDCRKVVECYNSEQPSPGHGTAVAGLIAAEGGTIQAPDSGDTVGILWEAQLHLARVRQSDDHLMVKAIVEKMAKEGVQTINMSISLSLYCRKSDGSLIPGAESINLDEIVADDREAWRELLRAYPELLIVQAAGNNATRCKVSVLQACSASDSGLACAVDSYPQADQVLCVAASSKDGSIYTDSNESGDALAAPGAEVEVLNDGPGTRTRWGTSLAAPQVTGAAALMRRLNPKLSPDYIHEILLESGSQTAAYAGQDYRILDLSAAAWQAARCSAGHYDQKDTGDICPTFNDMPGDHWAKPAVDRLACDCVLEGYSDGSFKPAQSINRAEFLKIALELAFPGGPFTTPNVDPYDDVDSNSWYAKYAAFAKDKGIIAETDENDEALFHPAKSVVRAEAVKIIVESAKTSVITYFQLLASAYNDVQANPGGVIDTTFSDVPSGSWFHDYVYAASAQCIIEGYPDGSFAPGSYLNRAEAARIGCIARYGYESGICSNEPSSCTPYLP